MIKKIILCLLSITVVMSFFASFSASAIIPSNNNADVKNQFDYNSIDTDEVPNASRMLRVWEKNKKNPNSNDQSNARIGNGAGPDCFLNGNPLNLCRSSLKPLFTTQNNNAALDRINLVFIYDSTYSNTPAANEAQLKNFLQTDGVVNLPAASSPQSVNFGSSFGMFSVEPLKSNINKFNFWYYDVKQNTGEPDIIASEFQFYEQEFGLQYLTPIVLTASTARNNAGLAVLTMFEGSIKYYTPGYGRVISMPQAGTPISEFATFVHESGHFLFGLADEYTDSGSTNTKYLLPNCVQYAGRGDLLWSDKLNQVDPFYNEVVTKLQNAGYPSNKIPTNSTINTSNNRVGCASSVSQYQSAATSGGFMNQYFRMPVFGSSNRSIIEKVLNLFSGTTAILQKPSYGNPSAELNSYQVNIPVLFNPDCRRYQMQSKETVECNLKLNSASYGFTNKNNIISLQFYSIPSASNNFTYAAVSAKGYCLVNRDNLNCDRIDVSNLSNRNAYLRIELNGWGYKLNETVFNNINALPISVEDSLQNNAPLWSEVLNSKNNVGVNKSVSFDKNSTEDILLYNVTNGNFETIEGVNQASKKFVDNVPSNIGYKIAGFSDFDGDGDTDILWRGLNQGQTFVWIMENNKHISDVFLPSVLDSSGYAIALFKDLDADNVSDVVWRNLNNGHMVTWLMNANGSKKRDVVNDKLTVQSGWYISTTCSSVKEANVVGIVLRNFKTNEIRIVKLENGAVTSSIYQESVPQNYQIKGCADVDGDGFDDIVWYERNSGLTLAWKMQLFNKIADYIIDVVPPSSGYELYQFGKSDNNKTDDLYWVNKFDGTLVIWKMQGTRTGFEFTLNNNGSRPVVNATTY